MYAGCKDDVKMVNRWFLLGIRVWPYSVLLVMVFLFDFLVENQVLLTPPPFY